MVMAAEFTLDGIPVSVVLDNAGGHQIKDLERGREFAPGRAHLFVCAIGESTFDLKRVVDLLANSRFP